MIKINKKRILIILVSLLVLGFVRNVNAQLIDPIEIKSVVTTTTGLHVLVQNNLNQDFSYEGFSFNGNVRPLNSNNIEIKAITVNTNNLQVLVQNKLSQNLNILLTFIINDQYNIIQEQQLMAGESKLLNVPFPAVPLTSLEIFYGGSSFFCSNCNFTNIKLNALEAKYFDVSYPSGITLETLDYFEVIIGDNIEQVSKPTVTMLSITTNPSGGNVYLDGVYKGVSPLTFSVSIGSHTIKTTKIGYYDVSKTVSAIDWINNNVNIQLGLIPSTSTSRGTKIVQASPPQDSSSKWIIIFLLIGIIGYLITWKLHK